MDDSNPADVGGTRRRLLKTIGTVGLGLSAVPAAASAQECFVDPQVYTLDFGPVVLGSRKTADSYLTLGPNLTDLSYSLDDPSGYFGYTTGQTSLGTTVSPYFEPTAIGTFNATLTITGTDSNSGCPFEAVINMSGTGLSLVVTCPDCPTPTPVPPTTAPSPTTTAETSATTTAPEPTTTTAPETTTSEPTTTAAPPAQCYVSATNVTVTIVECIEQNGQYVGVFEAQGSVDEGTQLVIDGQVRTALNPGRRGARAVVSVTSSTGVFEIAIRQRGTTEYAGTLSCSCAE